MKAKLLLFAITIALISSCSETEQIEDFISGSWELESYSRNGVDETSEILITNYVETYETSGTYSRSYVDGKEESVQESGEYIINEGDMTLHISNVSSISDFSEEHSSLSSSMYQVITINDTALVYSFDNGGDTHKFGFTRR